MWTNHRLTYAHAQDPANKSTPSAYMDQSLTYLCACAGSGPGECRPLQVHREQQVWRDQRQPLPQHRGGARYQVG